MVDAGSPHIDGAGLSLFWSIPFAGLILSIALLPLLAPHFWEHHFGKVAALWSLALLLPCAVAFGLRTTAAEALHTVLLDYLPFLILLFTLFVVAGGIRVSGNLVGTPATNTAMLAFGTLAANLFGTTGASMVLIRPVISANLDRRYNAHIFIFFIFLVANIGGSLTPFPPLYLGFLNGVDFFWTLKTMLGPLLFVGGVLLALFYVRVSRWPGQAPRIFPNPHWGSA
jgi:Na+/H+ antiporter NhaD/arsenite permease-like protein